jgi:hypothetical protein
MPIIPGQICVRVHVKHGFSACRRTGRARAVACCCAAPTAPTSQPATGRAVAGSPTELVSPSTREGLAPRQSPASPLAAHEKRRSFNPRSNDGPAASSVLPGGEDGCRAVEPRAGAPLSGPNQSQSANAITHETPTVDHIAGAPDPRCEALGPASTRNADGSCSQHRNGAARLVSPAPTTSLILDHARQDVFVPAMGAKQSVALGADPHVGLGLGQLAD